jgi:hypothetical protein
MTRKKKGHIQCALSFINSLLDSLVPLSSQRGQWREVSKNKDERMDQPLSKSFTLVIMPAGSIP